MSGEACPLPDPNTPRDSSEQATMQRMLEGRRIAVVGLSDDPEKPSNWVSAYLQQAGFTIVPVNPNHRKVLGEACYPTLTDVPGPIDVVLVFRRSEQCAGVGRQAVAMKAKGLWLQSGIRNAEARRLAQENGIDYVEDRCMMIEHQRQSRAR